MIEIHHSARLGFARAADAYERARPSYPAEAVAWLARRLELAPGVTVVDLAAGTGKLTRELVATGARTIAVEPVAAMRAKLERLVPHAAALEGVAEAIPLPAASADAVAVAQAFHWFDGLRALAEVHRVLRPRGRLAIVYNRRDLDDPVQAAVERVMKPHRRATPAYVSGRWRDAVEATELFGALEPREFPWVHEVDADGLVDRVASTSFIAELPDDARAGVLAEVRALASDLPSSFGLPYVAEIFVTTRLGG